MDSICSHLMLVRCDADGRSDADGRLNAETDADGRADVGGRLEQRSCRNEDSDAEKLWRQ